MKAPGDGTFHDGMIEFIIDLRVYRLAAIAKASYRLADRCTVISGVLTDDTLPISLRFKPTTSEASAQETARLFFQELLDQELREQIAVETGPVRALILAHAFSKADLIKRHDK